MKLRRAEASDLDALAGIFVAAWRQGYPGIVPDNVIAAIDVAAAREIIGQADSQQPFVTAVAEVSEGAAGYVQYGADTDARDDRTGYVAALYVHPDQASQGIGRELLDHAIAELARQGRDRVRLWVFADNKRAARLYASAGFRPDGAELTDPRWQTKQIRMQRDPGGWPASYRGVVSHPAPDTGSHLPFTAPSITPAIVCTTTPLAA
jgi:ribosomal protein S18 acetylase RimI-like enzyme